MGAIKVTNYQNLADFYNDAINQVTGVSDYYYNAALEVVLLQAFDPELDLLSPFYNAYLAARALYANPPAAVISAVGALQRHVLNKSNTTAGGRYTDINDWLDANNTYGVNAAGAATGRTDDVDTSFQVPQEFATLSGQAGYVIDDDLIAAGDDCTPVI